MTVRRVLLPSELPDEATSATSSDWGVIQVSGERKLRKIRPGVLPPKSVGTAEIADEAVTRAQIADYPINAITGWSTAPVALGSVASAGSATTISRSDHVHPYPSASNVGAAPAGGSTATDWSTKNCIANGGHVFYGYTTTGTFVSSGELQFKVGGTLGFFVGATGNLRGGTSTTTIGITGSRFYAGYFNTLYDDDGVVQTSDGRTKVQIEDSDLGLDFIQSLRPRKYRRELPPWRGPGQADTALPPVLGVRPHYGFIAQEVKQVLGESDFAGYIDIEQKGELLGLRYTEFIAPLVKAVQELAARVEALEAQSGCSGA